MMEVKLLQQELERSRRHLSEMSDKYNYLECDVADDWTQRYGRNKVQIRMSMEKFELKEESLRNEIKDMQNEMEEQNRSLVLVCHIMDSPKRKSHQWQSTSTMYTMRCSRKWDI